MKRRLTWILVFCLMMAAPDAQGQTPATGEWGVLFYSDHFREPGLYWIPAGGGDIEPVIRFADIHLSDQRSVVRASLSPDGNYLTVTASPRPGSTYHEFFLLEIDTGAFRPLTNSTRFLKEMVWSPDSRRIAYVDGALGNGVALIDIGSGAESRVIDSQRVLEVFNRTFPVYWDLAWSSNSRQLAVSVASNPTRVESNNMLMLDTNSGDLRLLFARERYRAAPSWQAGTNSLFYTCSAPRGRLTAICAIDLERSLTLRIADLSAFVPASLWLWSIDVSGNGEILFALNSNAVYLLDPATRQIRTLVDNLVLKTSIYNYKPRWFYRTAAFEL